MVPGKKGASRVRNMCQVPGTIRREARRAVATPGRGMLNIQPRIYRGWRHHLLSFATLYRHAPFLPCTKTQETDALLELLIFIRLIYRTISGCVSTAIVSIPTTTTRGIPWLHSTVSFRECYISYWFNSFILFKYERSRRVVGVVVVAELNTHLLSFVRVSYQVFAK